MTEDKKDNKKENVTAKTENVKTEKVDTNTQAAQATAKSIYGEKVKAKKFIRKGRGGKRGGNDRKDEFDQRILDIARVTRVMAGGKRMRFRACVVIGDKKGKVGVGLGKSADVTGAVTKAVNRAKKTMVDVPILNESIPHEVFKKEGASRLLFKPARKGRGVIAGGVVRVILEMAGIKNITSKILGTNNKINNAKCTIEALRSLKRVEDKVGNKKSNNKKEVAKSTEVKKDVTKQ